TLVAELANHARQASVEAKIRAVILTGSGHRAFCAGANLKERTGWTEDDIRRWLVELHAGFREIERCSQPWIAALNGLALRRSRAGGRDRRKRAGRDRRRQGLDRRSLGPRDRRRARSRAETLRKSPAQRGSPGRPEGLRGAATAGLEGPLTATG